MAFASPRRFAHRSRRVAAALLVATALAAPPVARAADCGYLYDDAFLASMKRTFGQAPPKRSGHVATMAECQAHLRAMLSDPQYRHDKLLHRTTCVCDGEGGGASGGGGGGGGGGGRPASGGTVGQQLAAAVVGSLLDSLLTFLNAPAGPDGEEVRRQVKAQWDAEERERKAALDRKARADFQQAQAAASGQLAGRPASADGLGTTVALLRGGERGPAHLGMGKVPPLLDGRALTGAEWAEAGAWQARIDALRGKGTLTPAEAKELAALEARRNARWARAAATPGLAQQARDALLLRIPAVDAGGLVADARAFLAAREEGTRAEQPLPLSASSKLVEASVTAGTQAYFEHLGEQGAELAAVRLTAEGKKVFQFGDALLIGNVYMAAKDRDPTALGGAGVSWLLGKAVEAAPTLGLGVGMAQAGGAVTAGLARHSIERLVEESDKLVPGMLAPGETGKDWFDGMKKELPLPQRMVAEWVGM